ncbi:MAG: hypothetical protein OXQ29_28345 [Rhodospirillaceae bacterium]|nr:hypothetical protein [Rhodospirillaceae bacterium]
MGTNTIGITDVGPWVLLVIGSLLMLAALYVAVAQQRRPLTLLLFGLLSIGVGIHGPLFMGEYAKFLKVVLAMVRDEDQERAYRVAFDGIARGDFSADLQEIALGYARSHPVPNMDSLLSEAIEGASNEPGQQALLTLSEELAKPADVVLAAIVEPDLSLEPVLSMMRATDQEEEAYQVVFDKIGQGDFSSDLQEIALGYARSHPIPHMDSLLSEAIGDATDKSGRDALIELNTHGLSVAPKP